MAKTGPKLTYIYLVDNLMSSVDDIKDKFRNELKYQVKHFPTPEALIIDLENNRTPKNRTRVTVFIEGESNSNQAAVIHHFVDRIKSVDPMINIIALAEKKDEGFERKLSLPASFVLVQKNPNAVLRITNHIMGIISQENLERKYNYARRSVQFLLLFVLVAALFTVLAYFIVPEYF